MKKAHVLRITGGILVFVCFVLAIYFLIPKNTVEFEFNELGCSLLFECTPSEFFDKEFDFYKETGDFRKKAYIDKNGYLHIILTQKQAKAWRETEWLSSFDKIRDMPHFELSSDYTSLTVYLSPELIEELAQNYQKMDYYQNMIGLIEMKTGIIKTIDGIPREEIHLELIEKDSETGEILYSTVFRPGLD